MIKYNNVNLLVVREEDVNLSYTNIQHMNEDEFRNLDSTCLKLEVDDEFRMADIVILRLRGRQMIIKDRY